MKTGGVIAWTAGILLVASSLAHAFLGWPPLRNALQQVNADADLLETVKAGWLFGSVAMFAFGVIVLSRAVQLSRGRVEREIVLNRRSVWVRFCRACGRETPMVTPEQAAPQAAVSARTIYQWVEAEKVHFIETQEGRLLICLNCLADAATSLTPDP